MSKNKKLKTNQNIKFYLTIVFPICVSIAIGVMIIVLNAKSVLNTRALNIVNNEKNAMNLEITSMNDEQKALQREEAQYDDIIRQNQSEVNRINELQQQLNDFDKNIEISNNIKSEVNDSLYSKQAYLDNHNTSTEETQGKEYTFKDQEIKCPSELPVGKYTASGNGTIYLRTIANSEKDRQDLSTIDTNSYTFTISSGESLKIVNEVKLTEITSDN